MHILEEVAYAIRIARGGVTHPVLGAVRLDELLGGISPKRWVALQQHLGCPLPPADDLGTVWDLLAHVARQRPDLELPARVNVAAWRQAQIVAGVRFVMAGNFGIPPERITRETSFIEDLGV